MNSKDEMIDTYRKEADLDYEQYLDWLDHQQEGMARLMEQRPIPPTTEVPHAEVCD